MKLISIFGLALLISCSTSRIQLENWDEGKEVYQVKGLQEFILDQNIRFGTYYTTSIKHALTSKRIDKAQSLDVFLTPVVEEKKQTLHFTLAERQGQSSNTYCISPVRSREISYLKHANSLVAHMTRVVGVKSYSDNLFAAEIFVSTKEKPWQLLVDNDLSTDRNAQLCGYLAKDVDNYYTIARIWKQQKNDKGYAHAPAAFEISNRIGQKVAVVSSMNDGVIILGHMNAEEKFRLANACTAILLKDFMN